MKLILHLSYCTMSCGCYDYYYSFEEESKEKAEYDILELCEKLKGEIKQFNIKRDEVYQKRPKNYKDQKKNELWIEEYRNFLDKNPAPKYNISYKGHSIDLELFYEEDNFLNLNILTPEEFYEQNLPHV